MPFNFIAVLFSGGANKDGVIRGGILWGGVKISATLSPLLEHGGARCPPSAKRVVAHNPQRPTKNDNDHEDGIDGTIPLLFAKMV